MGIPTSASFKVWCSSLRQSLKLIFSPHKPKSIPYSREGILYPTPVGFIVGKPLGGCQQVISSLHPSRVRLEPGESALSQGGRSLNRARSRGKTSLNDTISRQTPQLVQAGRVGSHHLALPVVDPDYPTLRLLLLTLRSRIRDALVARCRCARLQLQRPLGMRAVNESFGLIRHSQPRSRIG